MYNCTHMYECLFNFTFTFAGYENGGNNNSHYSRMCLEDSRKRSPAATTCAEEGKSEYDEDEEDCDESDSRSNPDNDSEPKKAKRTRTAFTNYQLDQLELMFAKTQYPDSFLREELSKLIHIKEDRIQVIVRKKKDA